MVCTSVLARVFVFVCLSARRSCLMLMYKSLHFPCVCVLNFNYFAFIIMHAIAHISKSAIKLRFIRYLCRCFSRCVLCLPAPSSFHSSHVGHPSARPSSVALLTISVYLTHHIIFTSPQFFFICTEDRIC